MSTGLINDALYYIGKNIQKPIIAKQVTGSSMSASDGSTFTLTATTVSGYTFLTWVAAQASGWSCAISFNPLNGTSNTFYIVKLTNTTGPKTITPYAIALYIRDDLA